MPANQKLSKFISAMFDDARSESNSINLKIEQRRQTYMEAAENEILTDVFNYIRTEVSKAKNSSGRMISRKTLENKRELFNARNAVTDKVLGQVKVKIAEFVGSPGYLSELIKMVSKASEQLNADDIIIYLRSRDLPLKTQIERGLDGDTPPVTFAAGSFSLGGIQAVSPSKKLRLDLTYDSRCEDARLRFAELTSDPDNN